MGDRPAPLVYDNFRRGITDYFVDCEPGYARVLDNLLLTPQGKPYLRPGSVIWNVASPVLTNAEACDVITRQWLTRDKSIFFQWAQNRAYTTTYDASVGTPAAFAAMTREDGPGVIFPGATSLARHYVSQVGEQQLVGWESSYLYGGGQPMKVYLHSLTAAYSVTAGFPSATAAGVTNSPQTPGSTVSYVYYFVYEHQYVTGLGTTFLNLGAPSVGYVVTAGAAVGGGAGHHIGLNNILDADISQLPYDSTLCKTRIYRTINGGTAAFLVGTIVRGVNSFGDTVDDATCVTGVPLYTNDGTYAYGLPPSCRYALAINGQGYYAHGVASTLGTGATDQPQRLWQSTPGIFDAVPATFFIDFEKPITALSRWDIYPMVFLKDAIYRVEGIIGALGEGEMVKRVVSGSVGCDCMSGIVVVGKNLYFPAQDGFYVCNGYSVEKISQHLNVTYAGWTSIAQYRRGMVGAYNAGDNRVYWSYVDPVVGGNVATSIAVLDLNFPTSGGGVFTTWSATPDSTFSVSGLYFMEDGSMLRAHSAGYLFKHDALATAGSTSRLRDPLVNTGVSSTLWAYHQVIPQLWTPVVSFGDKAATKWSAEVFCRMHGADSSGVTLKQHLALFTEINRTNTWVALSQYHLSGIFSYRDYAFRRLFPALTRRCQFRSMALSMAWTIIGTSDTGTTTATVTGTNTVTLSAGSWQTDIEDAGSGRKASIYFAADGYVAGYPILTRAGGTLTVSGAPANRVASKWVIRGYPQDQCFNFESLEIPYSFHGGASNVQASGLTGVNLPS